MVNSFSAWCFDSSRKAGDTAIVKSDFGYHIMYFVGTGKLTAWQYAAKTALEDVNFECQRLEIVNSNLDFQLKSVSRELKQNISILEALEEENKELKKQLNDK